MLGFSCSSLGKESPCNAGDLGSIPGLGRSPGGGHDNPLQRSFLEDPHGQRSLVGCSPQGRKESAVTEGSEHSGMQACHCGLRAKVDRGRRETRRSRVGMSKIKQTRDQGCHVIHKKGGRGLCAPGSTSHGPMCISVTGELVKEQVLILWASREAQNLYF